MFDKLNDYLMLSVKKGYAATILLALASHAEAEGKRIIFTLLSSNNPEIIIHSSAIMEYLIVQFIFILS